MLFINCNQISTGLQRKKFEYLYKLNTYASLYREYTHGVTYFGDLEFYEGRIKKLYNDVNNMETLNGWGTSRILKETLMKTVEENLENIEILKKRKFPMSENIRKEYDVIIMNERADNFMNELQNEISKAGRE